MDRSSPTRARTGGGDTRKAALAAFEDIARETGPDAVSMRAVARRTGLTLAALQYHFPSKSNLMEAFVDAQVDAYGQGLDGLTRDLEGDPVSALRAALEYAADLSAEHADGVFEMLRLRARREPTITGRFDQFMDLYLERIAALLGRARPDMSAADTLGLASILVATLEGLETVSSAAGRRGVDMEALKTRLISIALG